MRIALTHPSYVSGIVAMSSTSRVASQAAVDALKQLYLGWVSTPTPPVDLMNIAIQGWGGDLDVNSDRCKVIKYDWMTRYNGASNVKPIFDCVDSRDDIVDRLREIKVPVLLIQGEKDPTWTVEEAEIAKKGLPDAELKIIPEEGHILVFARKSDDINHLIEGFLKKQGY
jgi:pimeloyl-ACP methyl ester carboxylesterase